MKHLVQILLLIQNCSPKLERCLPELPDAKLRGFNRGRFSFNLSYGQCEVCDGHRYNRVEMHFLPDVWIPCENCNSTGYNAETLEVRYKGKNISEVLQMTVHEALELFSNISRIKRPLQMLSDVGLDYIQLGQSATTLSGGEAQRVKLARNWHDVRLVQHSILWMNPLQDCILMMFRSY